MEKPRVRYWFDYFMGTRGRTGRTVKACYRDALEVAQSEAYGPRYSLSDFSIDGVPFAEWFARQVRQ